MGTGDNRTLNVSGAWAASVNAYAIISIAILMIGQYTTLAAEIVLRYSYEAEENTWKSTGGHFSRDSAG
jgi:hypothetical protein